METPFLREIQLFECMGNTDKKFFREQSGSRFIESDTIEKTFIVENYYLDIFGIEMFAFFEPNSVYIRTFFLTDTHVVALVGQMIGGCVLKVERSESTLTASVILQATFRRP